MNEAEVVEVIEHRLETAEEKFFAELWYKGFELALGRANDALSRAINLGTAMAGGSLVLLKEDICYGWWRVIAASLFLTGLAVAVYGSSPLLSAAPMNSEVTRAAYSRATVHKAWYAKQALRLIVLGLLAAVIGAAIRQATR